MRHSTVQSTAMLSVFLLAASGCDEPAEPGFQPAHLEGESEASRALESRTPPAPAPLRVVTAPFDLTTAFRGEPEVVVLTELMTEAEATEFPAHITVRSLDGLRDVPAEVEYVAPNIEAGLRDHRFVVHTGTLADGWYVLDVTESAPDYTGASARRGLSATSARFRVGSFPVVRRVSFAQADDEVGVSLSLSERVVDERPTSELFQVLVGGALVACEERNPADRSPDDGFDAVDLSCAPFDVDQEVTVRLAADVSTAEGTLLDIGPLGTDGEIRVNPVRGDLIEDEAVLFAPPRTIERARPARKS